MASSDDFLTQYLEHGYAIIRGHFTPEEVEQIAREADRVYAIGVAEPTTWRRQNLYFDIIDDPGAGHVCLQAHWVAWVSPLLERLRRDPRYRAVLEPLLGPDIRQSANQIHWKPPGAVLSGFRFHQDFRFFRRRMPEDKVSTGVVQTILAIDPQHRGNGCLRIFPGSHKLGYLGLADEGDGYIMKDVDTPEYLNAHGLSPEAAVDCLMDPGDLLIFHPLTVHGSSRASADEDRRIFLNAYQRAAIGERAEWAFRGGESIPLGATPTIIKYDDIYENTDIQYLDTGWVNG